MLFLASSSNRKTRGTASRLERAIARVLVVAMIGITPGSVFAGDEFPDADNAILHTEGSINNNAPGLTVIDSLESQGLATWPTGINQGVDNTLRIDQPSADSTFTNQVNENFTAHLDGTLLSNGNVVIASPFGIFLGATAVLDVGSLLAIGGSITTADYSNRPDLELTGDVENYGTITADRNVLFYGRDVENHGTISAGTGEILMLGAESVYFRDADVDSIVSRLLNPIDYVAVTGSGTAVNHGLLQSKDATLIGSRVANYGQIEIADGSLMMLGADAVYVRQFDNPILVRLPHQSAGPDSSEDRPEYSVENHGQIRAGLGHVRLAASDPLGWGIRQGTGNTEGPAAIEAKEIIIAGGDNGRVSLSGDLDASGRGAGEVGGQIDITGDIITLDHAHIDASGRAGGGTIQIGGEQQGRGDLQRASALVMNETSEVRADALKNGDGGRVILFSEELTLIGGALSARGGEEGGNGGFIETSGLRNFNITMTPDAFAPAGQAGEWLIDPYTINIVAAGQGCDTVPNGSCINRALEAILSPNFDGAAFDGILRTYDPDIANGIINPNNLSVDLLVRALASGTNVTLSTEITSPDDDTNLDELDTNNASANGDINLNAEIIIRDVDPNPNDANVIQDALRGTSARLTLLAAGNININQGISVRESTDTDTSDFALSLAFRANDQSQRPSNEAFGLDQVVGSVNIDADITTGGGSVEASGISITQTVGSNIETDGGSVTFTSGSFSANGSTGDIPRQSSDPVEADPSLLPGGGNSFNPGISILGNIDTTTPDDDGSNGGAITLIAGGIGISTSQSGDDELQIDTGELLVRGNLTSGGGNISLSAGTTGPVGDTLAGNVEIDGSTISSNGGNILVSAVRVDPLGDNGQFDITFIDPSHGEGGSVSISNDTLNAENTIITTEGGTLIVGSEATQNISIEGTLSTLGGEASGRAPDGEDGLLAIRAGDSAGVDTNTGRYGRGAITIGANDNATLSSAGIFIQARDITTSSSDSPNIVSFTASGQSASLVNLADLGTAVVTAESEPVSIPVTNEITVNGDRMIEFGSGTALTADRIRINAALLPDQLNAEETNGVGQTFPAENTTTTLTRLTFAGAGGNSAMAGVRLSTDDISIVIGDGTSATTGLEFEPLVDDEGTTTAFGFQRGSRGAYDGLQLRDQTGTERPEMLTIRQDGDLTIGDGSGAPNGELFFGGQSGTTSTGGAFGSASIGSNGIRTSLESSDGILSIESADGLNSDIAGMLAGDAGLSWLTLRGGLLLPTSATDTTPPIDSVRFGEGGAALASPFQTEGLTVSTPRNFTITTQITNSIAQVADLEFQAGRNTGVDEAAQDGTLTIEADAQLESTERIALHAGASGFGDLVFGAGGATRLATNNIQLRAGAGADSQNTDTNGRSKVLGIANVSFEDAAGASFQGRPDNELEFSFRQDAGIDSDVDLPSFAQFGADLEMSFSAAGSTTPITYKVRSDFGSIDFTGDALGGDRFTGTTLSLVGFQTNLVAAILVDQGFSFTGPLIELGAVEDFTYTQSLAAAFNPTNAAGTRLTLRAAMNGNGTLRFESGVAVEAARIDLVASEGNGGLGIGTIVTTGATFDLSDANIATPVSDQERIFVFQEDEDVQPGDLPDATQFTGGLPNVLALRNDNGRIDIADFDISALPIDLAVDSRVILEADSLLLRQQDGDDLQLTTSSDPAIDLSHVHLRLRANTLGFEATGSSDSDRGQVLAGARSLTDRSDDDAPVLSGDDAHFDGESLLIEAFDPTTDIAETNNLSTLSQTEADPDMFDLTTGRSPTILEILQDGAVTPDNLPQRNAFSGQLAQTRTDDRDGNPVATNYTIQSEQEAITVTPGNVSGSNLVLGLNLQSLSRFEGDITFEADPADLVFYDFTNLSARTEGSIIVKEGVRITADDTITLAAADLLSQPTTAFDLTNPMGRLEFEMGGGPSIQLTAEQILLSAGPIGILTNPDGPDAGSERDRIGDGALAFINFQGLESIDSNGPSQSSGFSAIQSANFNLTTARGNVTRALVAGAAETEWRALDLASIQGTLTVGDNPGGQGIQEIGATTRQLSLGRIGPDARVVVQTDEATPFGDSVGVAGFEERVQIESNDVQIEAVGDFDLDLSTPNLQIVGSTTAIGANADTGTISPEDDGLDDDALDRATLRIVQSSDFATTTLPRADSYFRLPLAIELGDQTAVPRTSLSGVNIILTTTGSNFLLGDSVREGATGGNLIVRAPDGANVALDFDGLTPGFGNFDFGAPDVGPLDFASLQLSSFAIRSSGNGATPINILVNPLLVAGVEQDRTINTSGDLSFDGQTLLLGNLSTSTRDITFGGDVFDADTTANNALIIQSNAQVTFEEDIGSSLDPSLSDPPPAEDPAERLSKLIVLLDSDATSGTPTVQFGRRLDTDDDGVSETPVNSNQRVLVDGDIAFLTADLDEPDDTNDPSDFNLVEEIIADLDGINSINDVAGFLAERGIGRDDNAPFATIGKSRGNLSFISAGRNFLMGSGERLSVGGDLTIDLGADVITPGISVLGDAAAETIMVVATEIGLVRRNAGVSIDATGSTSQDRGSAILANTIDFGDVAPKAIGRGKEPRFGVPNINDPSLPAFLDHFPLFANFPSGDLLEANSFAFVDGGAALLDQVPSPFPRGASRSELTGAFGPVLSPTPSRNVRAAVVLVNADRLRELAVESRETPNEVLVARLTGAAIIDDLGLSDEDDVFVTETRLDEKDAEAAIALYEDLFGPDGELAENVRYTLQTALDTYLETTRARRVVGFELRRFVKNRPNSLLEAYTTLDSLDALFRYHRRLGLSPGEFRKIQREWLAEIQPDGISLDELSEAIHPSRYVRGSDILDIFGR
jgi:filamentous hemagglutinin family protein